MTNVQLYYCIERKISKKQKYFLEWILTYLLKNTKFKLNI